MFAYPSASMKMPALSTNLGIKIKQNHLFYLLKNYTLAVNLHSVDDFCPHIEMAILMSFAKGCKLRDTYCFFVTSIATPE